MERNTGKYLSKLTINVFDSLRLDDNKVTIDLVNFYRESKHKLYGPVLTAIIGEIKKVNDNDVGVVKFTYKGKDNKEHAGTYFFFRGPENEFYEMELISHGREKAEFTKVADHVFNSLQLKFQTD